MPPAYDESTGLAIKIQTNLFSNSPSLSPAMEAESEQLVEHLLCYIHQHYPYEKRWVSTTCFWH
ncbi:hypothetical protein [Aeromonas sobria]|uniref:hypothetical protein n=1 Tax=Aeromonas sobria TaxID=646 RepID=UPI001117C978|nr:hypothetical protein [Aeromonas sobria]TNI87890.1 hypothetical protein CF119_04895 [Aeromonas sobria]